MAVEGEQPARPRLRWARAIRAAGVLIAVAALALCVRTLVEDWAQVRASLRDASVGGLGLALGLSAIAVVGLGLLWWWCLRWADVHVSARRAMGWYLAGELGKYLPGAVWSVLGRAELARRGGVSRATSYATTLLGYAVMALAALLAVGGLAPFATLGGHGAPGVAAVGAGLIGVALLLVHPAVLGRLSAGLQRMTGSAVTLRLPGWSRVAAALLAVLPAWLCLGGAAVALSAALGVDQQPARVALSAVLAWLIGFLAVPVPAGVGVRELVFVAACGLPSAPATAVAVLARLLLVIVDAGAGAVALGAQVRRS